MSNLETNKRQLSPQKKQAIKLACTKSAMNRTAKRSDTILKSKIDGINDTGEIISKRDLFMLGIGLYWGEGYKRGNNEFGFTNSDPEMIKIYLKILRDVYNIQDEQLVLKININMMFIESQLDIERYWRSVTQINKEQFTKTTVIQSKLNKKYNIEGYKGTIRIKVKRGEFLKTRILESIQQIQRVIKAFPK
jgi:hypothetical protein